jgi:hypothetical protein
MELIQELDLDVLLHIRYQVTLFHGAGRRHEVKGRAERGGEGRGGEILHEKMTGVYVSVYVA